MAAKEVVSGQDSCDACRRVLEAMHYDWHQLLRRLDSVQALHIDANWQVAGAPVSPTSHRSALRAVLITPRRFELACIRHSTALPQQGAHRP